MSLLALLSALQTLKLEKKVHITIYTSVYQVSTGLNKNMYNWAKNKWKTSKGRPPQHVELWQQIHAIVTDPNRFLTYQAVLQNEKDNFDIHRLKAIGMSQENVALGKSQTPGYSLA